MTEFIKLKPTTDEKALMEFRDAFLEWAKSVSSWNLQIITITKCNCGAAHTSNIHGHYDWCEVAKNEKS